MGVGRARESRRSTACCAGYILPLSLLAPVATMIGMKFFDAAWDEDIGYMVPPQDIFTAGATTLFASIVSVFALAGIFVLIAPMYGSSRDYRKALEVATYGAIPVMLAGATLVLPIMAIIGLAGLSHSLLRVLARRETRAARARQPQLRVRRHLDAAAHRRLDARGCGGERRRHDLISLSARLPQSAFSRASRPQPVR